MTGRRSSEIVVALLFVPARIHVKFILHRLSMYHARTELPRDILPRRAEPLHDEQHHAHNIRAP